MMKVESGTDRVSVVSSEVVKEFMAGVISRLVARLLLQCCTKIHRPMALPAVNKSKQVLLFMSRNV